MMAIWVLVPVKEFSSSKSRLADLCNAEERARLAEAMLRDTLTVVSTVEGISGVALVTADPIAAGIGRDSGAMVIEDNALDLNGALSKGRNHIRSKFGTTGLLILPIDLPALTRDDIKKIIDTDNHRDRVVLVPDHERDGTNTILLGPDADIEFEFGPGSFERHVARATAGGLKPTVVSIPRVAWDFDNPADLDQILRFPIGKQTFPLLSGLSQNKRDVAYKVS